MKKESIVRILPLFIFLIIVPIVVMVRIYDCGLQENTWFSTGGKAYDFFLYYKSRVLMWAGALSLCFLVFHMANKDKGNWNGKGFYIPLIPAGIFAVGSLFSALFSEHSHDAIWGGYEQFEGVLVLLSYVVAFCLAYGYVTSEKLVEMLIKAFVIGSLIVSVLGAFQAIGIDYIKSDWAHGILTLMEPSARDLNFKLNFDAGIAYSTLYNPNYVGSYVAVALPMTIVAAVTMKKLTWKILALVSSVLQIVMLVASQSLTGSIGLVGAVVVFIVFLIPWMKEHWKISVVGGAVVLVAVISLTFIKPELFDKLFGSQSTEYYVASIVTEGDEYIITNREGKEIRGTIDGALVPEEEKEYLKVEKSTLELADGTPIASVKIKADGKEWTLAQGQDGMMICNAFGRFDYLREIPKMGFEDNYHFATKRGYIWSRTFPLLAETAIIGKGADNFVYAYPNDDYIGKSQLNYNGATVTKPHNMYLQIWVQDGMLACLAFVVLFVMLWICTMKSVFKIKEKESLHYYLLAILCSVTGYMVVGLANDSTISVAPILWILMGMGFAIGKLILEKSEKKL